MHIILVRKVVWVIQLTQVIQKIHKGHDSYAGLHTGNAGLGKPAGNTSQKSK